MWEWLMQKLGRTQKIQQYDQRNDRTEAAIKASHEAHDAVKVAHKKVAVAEDRVTHLRKSFEHANKRLGTK